MIRNVVFGSQARVVLQSRTKFWKGDVSSINLETGDPAMYLVYQTADEVPGTRGVLMGSGRARCHRRRGRRRLPAVLSREEADVEQAIVHNWAKDPWAFGCERMPFPLGQLKKFWPHIMEPVGRIHFAGSFADNLPWGMDAATRPPTAWRPRSTRFETEVEQRIGPASFLIRALSAAHSTLIRSMASSEPLELVATLSSGLPIFQAKGN